LIYYNYNFLHRFFTNIDIPYENTSVNTIAIAHSVCVYTFFKYAYISRW